MKLLFVSFLVLGLAILSCKSEDSRVDDDEVAEEEYVACGGGRCPRAVRRLSNGNIKKIRNKAYIRSVRRSPNGSIRVIPVRNTGETSGTVGVGHHRSSHPTGTSRRRSSGPSHTSHHKHGYGYGRRYGGNGRTGTTRGVNNGNRLKYRSTQSRRRSTGRTHMIRRIG